MGFFAKPAVVVLGCALVGACSSGSGSSSGGSTPAAGGGTGPVTLFGSVTDTDIAVQSQSATSNGNTGLVSTYANAFTLRPVDEFASGNKIRRVRYGRTRATFQPLRNYSVPLTVTSAGGQDIGTGSATFTGDAVESAVVSRTITMTDVEQANSVFGVFSTNDTGTAARGNFFDIHAYSAGIAATALPNTASYTGTFYANVISDGTLGTTNQLNLPANVNVNFLGNIVTGTLGAIGSPDITLNGSVSGTTMTGTATVSSTGVTLANGSAGTFSGGFYGTGASEIAATLGISDTSGATNHEMIGAFGGIKQ